MKEEGLPVDARAVAQDGIIALRQERFQDAQDALLAASAAAPDWADPWAYLSSVQLALGKPREAQVSIERALELSPAGFASNQKAGELSIRLGQLGLAEDHFLAAVRAAGHGSGDQRAAQKCLEHTRRMLSKSIQMSSGSPDTSRMRAWFRMQSRGRRTDQLATAAVEGGRD